MTRTNKQTIGQKGEDLAVIYLKKQGFQVIERNYWQKWGEIDIIASKNEIIHFVEVKTVSRDRLEDQAGNDYEPEDNVHVWKRQRLARTIQTYLLARKTGDEVEWQVDVLSVYLDREGNLLKVDWLEDVEL